MMDLNFSDNISPGIAHSSPRFGYTATAATVNCTAVTAATAA